MPTFRILDQRPVYFDLAGNLANGGNLKFYETGTTTPKDVYGDPGKTVNNGSSVTIGTDGRPVVDIWGDGSYRVRLYDADGTLIDEADDVEIQGGGGTTIPALEAGKVLSNDGALLQWLALLQVPDPTGSSGKVLSNDGTNFIWQSLPASDNPVVDANSLLIGTFLIQKGSGTAPASGTSVSSVAVTFATAYTSVPTVFVQPIGPSGLNNGWIPVPFAQSVGTTGFTAYFDSNSGFPGQGIFTSTQAFSWIALGIKTS